MPKEQQNSLLRLALRLAYIGLDETEYEAIYPQKLADLDAETSRLVEAGELKIDPKPVELAHSDEPSRN